MNDMLQRLAILWDDSFVLLVHSSLEHAVQRILIVSLFIQKVFHNCNICAHHETVVNIKLTVEQMTIYLISVRL